nr:hypothetical protein [Desulfobacula sp.]
MAWVKVNRGNENNLRGLLKNNPYFTSDSDLTAIKSQIRGAGEAAEKPEKTGKDILLRDLLFLRMARQCDLENESIDIQLKNIDTAGSRMLSALLGEEGLKNMAPSGRGEGITDPGAVMTRERIEAWSRCMIHHGGFRPAGESPLFVTTSEAVADYLETISSDAINALDIDPIKVHENDCENKTGWRQQVFEQLISAAKGDTGRQNYPFEGEDGCLLSGQIKLSLFSGNNVRDLFNLKDKQIRVCLIRLK